MVITFLKYRPTGIGESFLFLRFLSREKGPFSSLFRGADTAKKLLKKTLFSFLVARSHLAVCQGNSSLFHSAGMEVKDTAGAHRSLIQPPKDKREDCAPPVRSGGRGCGKGPRDDQEMASGISGIRTMHQSGNLVRRQELSTNPLTDGGGGGGQ